MTRQPACCTPDASLQDVALLMVKHDCGQIPVIESELNPRPLGVVTDRDIVCRVIAAGKDPRETTAADCMSTPCVTLPSDASIEDCCDLLEKFQIRRLPIVDKGGLCKGIVAQADIATRGFKLHAAGVLREVSEPNQHPSRLHLLARESRSGQSREERNPTRETCST